MKKNCEPETSGRSMTSGLVKFINSWRLYDDLAMHKKWRIGCRRGLWLPKYMPQGGEGQHSKIDGSGYGGYECNGWGTLMKERFTWGNIVDGAKSHPRR